VGEGTSFRARAGRRAQQRMYRQRGLSIALELDLQRLYVECGPLVVRLVRISPRAMDGDNLESAFKRVRDGIAAVIGIDDREDAIEYLPDQQRGKPGEQALLVEVYAQRTPAPGELKVQYASPARTVTYQGDYGHSRVTPNVR